MRLAHFIRENLAPIIGEWEKFAASLTPAAASMSPRTLRNHIKPILAFVAEDLETPQSSREQIKKSHGDKPKASKASAAETHAALRLAGGFNLDQMVSEFRALRASVIKLWGAQITRPSLEDLSDATRFNEAIDQTITEAISHYSEKNAQSRDLFLGILSHDLRNPLGSIEMSAALTSKVGTLTDRQTILVSQITESVARATEIVNHLLDLTRSRLGSGLDAVRAPMDMDYVSKKMVAEMRAIHPSREFTLEISGDLKGSWDKARIGQVFSNLLGNAVRYSFADTPIRVKVEGPPNEVILSVRNEGVPIPSDAIDRIFDSLIRAEVPDGEHHPASVNLGLGLYITKEIVMAHAGTIGVTSSEVDGTNFTVRLPRSK